MKFKVSSIQSLFKLNRPSCVRVSWHQWLDSSVGNREKLSKSPLIEDMRTNARASVS